MGPDKISLREIRAFDPKLAFMLVLFNGILFHGCPPKPWLESKTIMIPKSGADQDRLRSIGGWRPITVSSTLMRIFHKVVLRRLQGCCSLDEGQTAFDSSACLANIVTLRTILARKKATKRPFAAAVLDIKSAFDSVDHGAIGSALASNEVPRYLRNYVMNSFRGSFTQIKVAQSPPSRRIYFQRGVKQGDPLSPFLFAIGIDPALRDLTSMFQGCNVDGERITHLVYADDMLLMADDCDELQRMLDLVSDRLSEIGLTLNPTKCKVYSHQFKNGKLVVDVKSKNHIKGAILDSVLYGDPVRYLGGTPWKKADELSFLTDLERLFEATKQAYLSPTQAAHMINDFGLPGLIARMQAAPDLSATTIDRIDQRWRCLLKRLLFLPHYLSDGVIYLPLSKGGLGFRSISQEVFSAQVSALSTVRERTPKLNAGMKGLESYLGKMGVHQTDDLKKTRGPFLGYCARKWEDCCTQATGMDCFLSGDFDRSLLTFRYRQGRHQVYTEHVKLRYQLLETGNVLSRLDKDRTAACRRCTAKCESALHVLNACPFSTAAMIKRHDAVQRRFVWALRRKWKDRYRITENNRFHDAAGTLYKPDLVLLDTVKNRAFIVDIAVYYETSKDRGETIMREKEAKYEPIRSGVAKLHNLNIEQVATLGIAVGSRGSFTKELLSRLRAFFLGLRATLNMAQSAAEGSIHVYHNFMGRTWNLRGK